MAIKYYVRKTKNPQKEGEVRYMAQAIIDGQVDQQTIIDRIVEKSSLAEGDVLSCVTEVFKEITAEMLEGHSVKMDNFGTFYLTVTSKSQEKEEDVTADCIEGCRMTFRPSTRWYNTIKPNVRYKKVAAPAKNNKKNDTTDGDSSSSGSQGNGGGLDE